jgi:hypothetical protein
MTSLSIELPGLAINETVQKPTGADGQMTRELSTPGFAGEPIHHPTENAQFSSVESTPHATPPPDQGGAYPHPDQISMHQQVLERAHTMNQAPPLSQLTQSMPYTSQSFYDPNQYNATASMQFNDYQFQPIQHSQHSSIDMAMPQHMVTSYPHLEPIGSRGFAVPSTPYYQDHSQNWYQRADFDQFAGSNMRNPEWGLSGPSPKLKTPHFQQSAALKQEYQDKGDGEVLALSTSPPHSTTSSIVTRRDRRTTGKIIIPVAPSDNDEDADGESDDEYKPGSEKSTITARTRRRAAMAADARVKKAVSRDDEANDGDSHLDDDEEPEQEGLYNSDQPGINVFLPRDQIAPVGKHVYAECLKKLGLEKNDILENDEKNKLRPSDFDIFFYKKNNSRGKMTWPQVKMFVEWQHRGEPDSDVLLKVPRTYQNRFNEVRKFFALNGEPVQHLKNDKRFHSYGHKKANQPNKTKTASNRRKSSKASTTRHINTRTGGLKRRPSEDLILPPPPPRRPRTRSYKPPESDIEEVEDEGILSTQQRKANVETITIYWDIYEVHSLTRTIQDEKEPRQSRSIVIERSARLRDGVFANGLEAMRAAEFFATPHMWRSCAGSSIDIDEMKRSFKNEMAYAVEVGVLGRYEIPVWRRTGEESSFECLEEREDVEIQLVPRAVIG